MIDFELDSTKNDFLKYLSSLGLSQKSYKNYKSDLNHFMAWAILKIRAFGSYVENLTQMTPFLGQKLAVEYKTYMSENSFPKKTINRRLSTLRHLARYLVLSQIIDSDFMNEIENLSEATKKRSAASPVINEFRGYLEKEKVSPNTIKNYISDIRQFLAWLENNPPGQRPSRTGGQSTN